MSASPSRPNPGASAPMTRLADARAQREGDQRDLDRHSVELLIRNIAEILSSEVVLYCRPDAEGAPEVISSWGVGPGYEPPTRPDTGGLVGRALGVKRAALRPLHPTYDAALITGGGGQLTHAIVAPVQLASATAGALVAVYSRPPPDVGVTLWAAESCAAMLALSLPHAGPVYTLLWASSLDTLTGCLNYAGTRYELDREINRSSRDGSGFSVCFVDLDNFKRVNDEQGHLRGNEVLARVARGLHECVRSFDTLGRFGGDEFIAIFPNTTETDAHELAARMRATVASSAVSTREAPLTASVGVAQWQAGETIDHLLTRADEALLRAKAHKAPRSVA